jgi:hypothetical protein
MYLGAFIMMYSFALQRVAETLSASSQVTEGQLGQTVVVWASSSACKRVHLYL